MYTHEFKERTAVILNNFGKIYLAHSLFSFLPHLPNLVRPTSCKTYFFTIELSLPYAVCHCSYSVDVQIPSCFQHTLKFLFYHFPIADLIGERGERFESHHKCESDGDSPKSLTGFRSQMAVSVLCSLSRNNKCNMPIASFCFRSIIFFDHNIVGRLSMIMIMY